jgi:hypothetical protein
LTYIWFYVIFSEVQILKDALCQNLLPGPVWKLKVTHFSSFIKASMSLHQKQFSVIREEEWDKAEGKGRAKKGNWDARYDQSYTKI